MQLLARPSVLYAVDKSRVQGLCTQRPPNAMNVLQINSHDIDMFYICGLSIFMLIFTFHLKG